MNSLAYVAALLRAGLAEHRTDIKRTAILSGFMFVQNFLFFTAWLVFFGSIGEIRGWRLEDMSLLYGLVAAGVGTAFFLCDGVRTLPFRVQDGTLDTLIVRPRHPLPALLFSRSSPASLGDILSAPVYWFVIGHAPLSQFPLLAALSLMGGVILLAILLMFYSIALWLPKSGRFADQLFEMFIIFMLIPQHRQPLAVKALMFTLMPAGFTSLIPVLLLRQFDATTFAILAVATVVYAALATLVFNAGLRRYVRQGDA